MLVNLEHVLVRSIRSVEQYVICFDELASDRHIDAHAEDIPVIHRTWVWVLDFVGCDASTGAIDILEIPIGLFPYEFGGIANIAVIGGRTLFETRGEVGLREKD